MTHKSKTDIKFVKTNKNNQWPPQNPTSPQSSWWAKNTWGLCFPRWTRRFSPGSPFPLARPWYARECVLCDAAKVNKEMLTVWGKANQDTLDDNMWTKKHWTKNSQQWDTWWHVNKETLNKEQSTMRHLMTTCEQTNTEWGTVNNEIMDENKATNKTCMEKSTASTVGLIGQNGAVSFVVCNCFNFGINLVSRQGEKIPLLSMKWKKNDFPS